ncbi:hypothetical protein D3C76_961970 [compost metagenome]
MQQAIENARSDAGRFISGMIGLQAGGQAAAQTEGAAELRDHADLLRDQDQVLYAHDLRDGRDHFRGQAGGEGAQDLFVGGVAEQPVAKTADGEMADHRKSLFIVGVDDQAGDFIGLIGDQHFLHEVAQRDVGQRHLRRHALAVVEGGDAGQIVPGARRGCLGHHFLEVFEAVGLGADGMGKYGHGRCPPNNSNFRPFVGAVECNEAAIF